MQYSRVLVTVFALLMAALLVVANPVPNAEKRQIDPTSLVSNLQSTLSGLTSQLGKIYQ